MLKKIYNEVTREWDTSVEEALKSFIRLPALSPILIKNGKKTAFF